MLVDESLAQDADGALLRQRGYSLTGRQRPYFSIELPARRRREE